MLSIGNKVRFFLSLGTLVISVGYCLVASAETPVTAQDASIKQYEASIKQQEALIKQQEAVIKQHEAIIKQRKTSDEQALQPAPAGKKQELYQASASQGKALFEKWCVGCHDPNSMSTKIGPGIKGILKRKTLPVSGQESTPDNIRRQMRDPYKFMPSQFGLTDEEMEQIIKYLEIL